MVDKDLLSLCKAGKLEELKTLLDSQDNDEIVKNVTKSILKGRADSIHLINSVLDVSNRPSDKCIGRCTDIFVGIIKILQKNEINSTTALEIIRLLLTKVKDVQPKCLGQLATFYIESVKNGTIISCRSGELLPQILSLIDSIDFIPKGENMIKGSEYKSHIINSICSNRWLPSIAIHMAHLFCDIPLTQEELKFVIEKVLRLFPEIDLADQPAAAFQLLLLSAKGHKKLVLKGICQHYTAQDIINRRQGLMTDSEDLISDASSLQTLRQIEGTVILHIMQAIEQDQKLGSILIDYMKVLRQSNASKVLSPFNLALLLSISQLHYFEDQIYEFVKSTVLKCFQDEERQQQSLWVRECFPTDTKTLDLVLETVEHSSYDWDQVTQEIVKLGFKLIDSFGPKLVFGAMPETNVKEDSVTPSQMACQLGQRLLLKTFKVHHIFREEILNYLFSELMKPTSPVTHYLDLLSDIVASAPQMLLESTDKIKKMFEKLDSLNPTSAERLLLAFQPLLKLSPYLKDTLILNLRKAMFSRPLDARKIGSLGFLMILKQFRVVGALPSSQISQPISLSQIQADVHSSSSPASNEALCLEIIGNLPRCLTQHADVRLSIYQGLYEVLHRNSELMNPVLDLLFNQLKKYYEFNEDVNPPISLEPCIISQGEQVYLAEPLAHLVGCAQQCLRKSLEIMKQKKSQIEDDEQDDDETQTLHKLQKVLVDLTKRVITAEMEDFELDKSADFSLATGVGIKNNINAILLLGIYEVLMEFTFEMGNFSIDSCKEILQLFNNYVKLSTVVKERSASSSGKKGKSPTSKTPNSLLSLKTLEKMLAVIICDERPQLEENGIDQLIEDKGFLPYLLSVVVQKLGQVASKGTCDGETQSKEKLLKLCYSIGRLLYINYVEKQFQGDDNKQKDKKGNIQILEGLSLVVEIACKNGQNAVIQCLANLDKEPETKERMRTSRKNEKIHSHIKKFQRMVVTLLNEDKEHQNFKELTTLLSVISNLSKHLPNDEEEYQQVNEWITKVATEHSINDAPTSRHVLSLLLHLAKQTKSLPNTLLSLCQDIHSQMGDIDQEVEVEASTHFSVTKADHCPTSGILILTLTYLEADLDDIDNVIKCHKAHMLAAALNFEEDPGTTTQVETLDKAICIRLGMLVNCFIELTHSAVDTSPCIHALLKAVTKLFNVLTTLTKHYISLYTNKAGHLGSRFEKLVRLVSQELTPQTYKMIIYVQLLESDCSEDNEKKEKGNKKTNAPQKGMIKAIKQGKMVPNLICTIEQLEKFLIQLSKKSKINLAENFKRSTSRDFRIISETVNTAVEQGISDDSDTGENDNSLDQVDEPQANESDNENEENKRPAEDDSSEKQPVKKKKKL